MLSDLSAGRLDEGQLRMKTLFRRRRSAAWKRRAQLALGIARLRRREFAAAAKILNAAEKGGGPAASFVALKQGEALIGAEKPGQALQILEGPGSPAPEAVLADDFAIAIARARTAQGFSTLARQALESHLASPRCRDRGKILEAEAKLLDAAGQAAAASDVYRRLYLELPRARETAGALDRLSALPPPARFKASDLPAVAARARALIDAGDGKGALATWDFALASIPGGAAETLWRLEIAEAAIEARMFGRALSLLGRAPARRGDTFRGLLLGRSLFGLGRDKEATASLRAAAEGTGGHAENALFLLATGLDQNDHDAEALAAFLGYIRRVRSGERLDTATWRAGWLSFRLGKHAQSARLFRALLERKGAAAYHPSALYWLGREQETEMKNAGAIGLYRRLREKYARDYYGLMAARRLAALGASLPSVAAAAGGGHPTRIARSPDARGGAGAAVRVAEPQDAPSLTSARPPGGSAQEQEHPLGQPPRDFCEMPAGPEAGARILAGCELELAGLLQDAEREYETAASAKPLRAVLLRLSEFALRRGDRIAAIGRLKGAVPDYLGAPIDSLPRRYWEVLFPRAAWDEIARFSKDNGLDPMLVCGLILQESAFNPLAASHAGALGLMQVLPQTGADAAKALRVNGFTPVRLLEPALNIRCGTWHFAGLLSRFDGNAELALAAYNAGETRVRRWRAAFGTSEITSFVEEVPYAETRLYVKRILSHAAMYHAIYGP